MWRRWTCAVDKYSDPSKLRQKTGFEYWGYKTALCGCTEEYSERINSLNTGDGVDHGTSTPHREHGTDTSGLKIFH